MYTQKKRFNFNCPTCNKHAYVDKTRQNIKYCLCKSCKVIYAVDKNTGRIINKFESEE